ncbi:actin nucleation-promoting factor WASL-like [Dreissena polymorpha]|uniref:actin nucleation-promoting factor WASL-like n=1 Tax=Dreissena polymorpha TaxID=45954 RepID=UPI00226534EC|nr:actin nucleation-promoting factor WASL-like [Dreissena polymorpha]
MSRRSENSLSTAVVELYLDDGTNKQNWNRHRCGIACFVKDNPQKSYFIRLYDPKTYQMVWEQVLTDNFVYKTLSTYFHTFEANVCQAGLKFASEKEAAHFQKMVEGKIMERVQKRMGEENYSNNLSQVQGLDPEIQIICEYLGMSTVDEETIDFIYDFVDKKGGLEELMKEIAQQQSTDMQRLLKDVAVYILRHKRLRASQMFHLQVQDVVSDGCSNLPTCRCSPVIQ